jgi:hypothetical protein
MIFRQYLAKLFIKQLIREDMKMGRKKLETFQGFTFVDVNGEGYCFGYNIKKQRAPQLDV